MPSSSFSRIAKSFLFELSSAIMYPSLFSLFLLVCSLLSSSVIAIDVDQCKSCLSSGDETCFYCTKLVAGTEMELCSCDETSELYGGCDEDFMERVNVPAACPLMGSSELSKKIVVILLAASAILAMVLLYYCCRCLFRCICCKSEKGNRPRVRTSRSRGHNLV